MERISTGNREADLILCGGFPDNSINVIMGAPGSGKTIFTEQLVFANASGGRPVLYLTTLSEPLAKFITYLQEYTFADLSRLGSDVLYEDIAPALADAPEKLGALVMGLIQEHRPRIIVIDSFKALSDLFGDMTAWRRVLYDLAGLLSAYSTTSFWVGEYTADMVTHRPEFAVADGILELVREQHGTRDERFLRVVKLRGSNFRDGYHAFSVTAGGLQVSPRLVSPHLAPDYTPSTERLESGIRGLDEMMESGWLRGSSTMVAGPSGSGKTVIGLHFLRRGVERGEPALLVNFQENPTQLARIMRQFGWEADRLIGAGKLDILYTSPVELQIDTLVRQIFERIEAGGVQRVVIDALGDLEKSAREPLRFREYLYAMLQHFAVRNVTAMLSLETASVFHGMGPPQHDVSSMSDNILLLEMLADGDLARRLRIVKARGSGHDGRPHPMRISPQGIEVS